MLYKINIPVNPIDTKIVVIIQTVFILKRSIAKNYAHLSILIMKITLSKTSFANPIS